MALQPDSQNRPPSAQTGEGGTASDPNSQWLERARKAFQSSTTYFDANFRKEWEDGLRAFNNQHPSDSKYTQPAFDKRSKIYRPRIRTVMRKNEAAAAAAFFSNMDVVSVDAVDPTNKAECAAADFMKQLLQYRLTKTIPWYQIVLGGLQDAQKQQAACAHIHWEYEEAEGAQAEEPQAEALPENEEYPEQTQIPEGAFATDGTGLTQQPAMPMGMEQPQMPVMPKPPKKDKPCIDLIPLENVRFDPGASWIDPVNSSPYWIHLIPMYVMDVKAKVESQEWNEVTDSDMAAARDIKSDSTRAAREQKDDRYSQDSKPVSDYEIVWVQRHIHRRDGKDWHFYTMGDQAMLSDPQPLEEVCLHGVRPYVLGVCNLETHKILPSSLPTLARGLIDETNELANQRNDNIKFVLNKKYIVKRGAEADVAGLVRNVPGGVVMAGNLDDIKEMQWNDITGSVYQETQGLGMEMDELLGNFNPASLMMAGANNSPARNMAMLGNAQGTLVEYLLRTYVETFVQPVLRQLVQLEQEYETDVVVMGLAAKKANLFQKYGVNQLTDELLKRELTLTVNVGMGATDPTARLNKFLTAMGRYVEMLQKPIPGIDMAEVGKEIFGHLGYADGSRFFTSDNPQVQMLQQQMQQMQGVIAELQKKLADKKEAAEIAKQKQIIHENSMMQQTHVKEANKRDMTMFKEEQANKRALATHWHALHQQDKEHAHDRFSLLVNATRPRPQGVRA